MITKGINIIFFLLAAYYFIPVPIDDSNKDNLRFASSIVWMSPDWNNFLGHPKQKSNPKKKVKTVEKKKPIPRIYASLTPKMIFL